MGSISAFGEHLKRERELRGVSLEEVSSATRISTRFLEAIEKGHWQELPGGAFNRGFIRSTSRYLGLDEDGMVAEYSLEIRSNGTTHATMRPVTDLPRDWKRIATTAGTIVLIVVAGWFVVSRTVARLRSHALAASTADTRATSKVAEAVAQPTAGSVQLVVRGSKTTGLRVIADGKAAFDGQILANEEKRFAAREGFEISASDPAAVRLELNGQPYPLTVAAGQPERITLTARDTKSSAGGVH
jgi:cytoskeleton protein RodZ